MATAEPKSPHSHQMGCEVEGPWEVPWHRLPGWAEGWSTWAAGALTAAARLCLE